MAFTAYTRMQSKLRAARRTAACLFTPAALLLLLALLAGAVLPGCGVLPSSNSRGSPTSSGGTDIRGVVETGGFARTYRIHLPPGYEPGPSAGTASPTAGWSAGTGLSPTAAPLAVVLILHGGGGDGDGMDKMSHFGDVADSQGFVAVFPDAVERNWNDGRDDDISRAHRDDIDDVGFISALIDHIAAGLPVDRRRVYATGISNGSMMSHRLACDLSDKIAAVALVAGQAPADYVGRCEPVRPVPLMMVNGTEDPLVPYGGGAIGTVRQPRGHVVSVSATTEYWSLQNGCTGPRVDGPLPDTNSDDRSSVSRLRLTGCRDGAGVDVYTVDGGGHTWPGGQQYLPPAIVGYTNRDIDASEVIWEFMAPRVLPVSQ